MNRRFFLAGASTLLAGGCEQRPLGAQPAGSASGSGTPSFPFELVTVPGVEALATFDRLRASAGKSPVVLGDDDSLSLISDNISYVAPGTSGSADSVLATARTLTHPQSLTQHIAEETRRTSALMRDMLMKRRDDQLPRIEENGRQLSPAETRERLLADIDADYPEPDMGDWPDESSANTPLGMILDYRTRKLPERVHIALIPTADWTEIPAYLRWGGWNACPPPEFHVAAFRSWRDRYGATLLALTGDSAELRVQRKPGSRDEALALARELYLYDNDLIDQGYDALAPLAANLMASDVWSFWWD